MNEMDREIGLALVAELRALREDLNRHREELGAQLETLRNVLDAQEAAVLPVDRAQTQLLERIARAVEAGAASRNRELTLRPNQPNPQGVTR